MSEALSALSQTVFFQPFRQLGTVIPDCAVEEHHSDRLQVTQHPVELGAMISDHAFMQPFGVSVKYAWSDSSTGVFESSQAIYQALQTLQQSREPFTMFTGKRVYESMVLTELEVTTDQHSENILMVEAHCQTVIIVSTSAASIAPASTQSMPGQTAGPTNLGQQQALPVSAPPSLAGI